jgi:glycosyltransferase involved in cell wall biosynthesis
VRREVEAAGVSATLIEAGRARHLWRIPKVIASLREALREHDAQIAFAHVTKAQMFAWPAARLQGLPSVWWQHEHLGLKRPLQYVAGRMPASAVICSARWTATEQAARFPKTPASTVYPGIEQETLPPARAHTAAAGQQVVVGIVGRLQRWKRVELALRAWPAVLKEEPATQLRVIGGAGQGLDEDYPDNLREEADRLEIAHAVQFLGQVADAEPLVADLDLLVHTAAREPFGIAVVEAMRHGVPVVAADEGGPSEIVRTEVDGLLVDVADPDALAGAVVELARDPLRRQRLGGEGRRRARERFSAERMAAEAWAVVRAVWAEDGGVR